MKHFLSNLDLHSETPQDYESIIFGAGSLSTITSSSSSIPIPVFAETIVGAIKVIHLNTKAHKIFHFNIPVSNV